MYSYITRLIFFIKKDDENELTLIIYLFLYTINLFYQSLVKIKWKQLGYVQVGGKQRLYNGRFPVRGFHLEERSHHNHHQVGGDNALYIKNACKRTLIQNWINWIKRHIFGMELLFICTYNNLWFKLLLLYIKLDNYLASCLKDVMYFLKFIRF